MKPHALALALAFWALCFAFAGSGARAGTVDQADEQYQFLAGLCEKQMFEMAVTEGESFLRDHPKHAKAELARYRLATALFELGKKPEAALQFEKLAPIEGFEYGAEAAFRLGQCRLEAKDLAGATKALDRALAAASGQPAKAYLVPPASFLIGEAAFQRGDFAAAELAYQRSLESSPATTGESRAAHDKDARYGLAWSRFRQQNFDGAGEAIDGFLRRHESDAASGEMRFLQGECHLEAGRPKEALAAYARVKDGPFADAALRGAAFARLAQGDQDGAAGDFARLLEKFPDSRFGPEAAVQCASIRLEKGDAAGAFASLAAKAAGDGAETLLWRARAESKLGDAKSALATVDKGLGKKPTDTIREQLQILRGDLLADLGDVGKASEAYAASASDYAMHAAAVARLNSGDVAGAAKLASSLLERFEESPYRAHAEIVLGEAELQAKRFDEAARHFDAAAKSQDAEVQARAAGRLAWCAFLAGDFKAAAKRFAAIAERNGADAALRDEALYMLGRAEESAKRPERAVDAWRRYGTEVKNGGHTVDALLGLVRLAPPDEAKRAADALLANSEASSAASVPGLDAALLALAERLRKDGDGKGADALLEKLVSGGKSSDPAARYALAYGRYEAGAIDDSATLLEGLSAAKIGDPALRMAILELDVFVRVKRDDPAGAATRLGELAAAGMEAKKQLELARLVAPSLARSGPGGPDAAEKIFAAIERTAKSDPSIAAEVAAERVWLALDRGDAKGAVKLIARVDPAARGTIDDAAFFTGEALFEAGEYAASLPLYTRAANSKRVADKALYKAGFAALKQDDFAAAEKSFARLVEDHPKSSLAGEGLYLLGESRFRQNRLDDALAPLQALRKTQPNHASLAKALFRIGIACGRLERWAEAEDALGELARRFPDFPNLAEAELWRGRSLAAHGNARAARQSLEKTIALDKGELAARARIELGRVHAKGGEHEKALAEFLKVAVLYGGDEIVAESLLCAGESLEALGDKGKAQAQYEELVAKYPKSPLAPEARQRIERIRTL